MKTKTVTSITFAAVFCWFAIMLIASQVAFQEAYPEPQSSEPVIYQVPDLQATPYTDTTGQTWIIYN